MTDTVFSKIIAGEIPSNKLYEDEHCIVIPDINPVAAVHVLVIPKKPIKMLSEASAEDQALLGHLMLTVGKVAEQLGVSEGYRVIVNNGADGGQTVFHLHLHIIAGFAMKEADM
ncbi:MAG: histidine triad nucleotide-binding protein [Cellvibrionales bacterium]|jgi:histidine triad (HIT) family protein|nr:histidine triad nucleotide-binding protein [Cellvibrionales bacterium]MBT5922709.1 histidine triad nucleotide-binding protein [Cellvibrionales bacterium]MBT6578644.1 histidine triad nucleotide-binding protein [Cellvibrionales bacterium]